MKMAETPKSSSSMERLAGRLYSLAAQTLTPEAEKAARLCLLDTLGCGVYGTTTKEAAGIFRAAQSFKGAQNALIWGTDQYMGIDWAAFICGSLCHVRELDDVHYAVLHTGAVCVPAALAVAQQRGSCLAELLKAIAVGVEAAVRVAKSIDYLEHRHLGWHGTATCGPFGAAAAAATLLGLDAEAIADAMAIAASRTGGTWAFSADNALTKRLHPGMAARDGVVAAYLANEGIRGPRSILEAADGGLSHYFSSRFDPDALDRDEAVLGIEEVEYKWFASCKSVHSPFTAASQIFLDHQGRGIKSIQRVEVAVNSSALAMAGRMYEPASVISAQLSIPYGVALGLMGKSGREKDYTAEALQDGELFRLASKVQVIESAKMNKLRQAEHKSGATVTVEWEDGHIAEQTATNPKGSQANPLTQADIEDKFMGLAGEILCDAPALKKQILQGDGSLPVSELINLLIVK